MVTSKSKLDPTEPETLPLTNLEARAIEIFVAAAGALRFPQSVGEIYGLLFVTPQPVSFEHIQRKLQISQGSASQGLKFLRELGAVTRRYVPSDRRSHFCAQTELWTLAVGILRDRIAAGMTVKSRPVAELLLLLGDLPEEERFKLEDRLKLLAGWVAQAQTLLPVVISQLGRQPIDQPGKLY